MSFHNKLAIVTSGTTGLGKDIVKSLLDEEIQYVVILDIDILEGKRACDEFSNKYGCRRVIHLNTDITNEQEFADAFKKIKTEFKKINIFINSTAIRNEKDLKQVLNINLISAIRGTELAIQHLEPDGVILNISSMSAFVPLYSSPYYAASKAGLLAYTNAIAYSKHSGTIRIQTLCPEYTNSASIFEPDCIIHFSHELQRSESVGRASVYVIKDGQNGAIWSIIKGNLSKVTLPKPSEITEVLKLNI